MPTRPVTTDDLGAVVQIVLNRVIADLDSPYYSQAEVATLLDRCYAIAQTDYREQVCDPAGRIAELLEEP